MQIPAAPPAQSDLACLILAGGRASRLASIGAGGDKALVALAGRPLIAHVLRRLLPDDSAPAIRAAISAQGRPERFDRFRLPVLPDRPDIGSGPLAGILAGLRWAQQLPHPPRWLLTVPTDTPFLPLDLTARLMAAARPSPDHVVMAAAIDGLQQVCALWPLHTADRIEAALVAGERRVFAVAASGPVVAVPFLTLGAGAVDPFFNINTPVDLRAAERVLAGGQAVTPVIGIVGWKNSGKTTLVERLVANLSARGLKIATIKHAHHGFDLDQPGTDSARHSAAGAATVTIVSSRRQALLQELRDQTEPDLRSILKGLPPSDLVIVEGYKRAPIAKIEARRRQARAHESLYPADPDIVAIASDEPVAADIPVYNLDDVNGLTNWIVDRFKLPD